MSLYRHFPVASDRMGILWATLPIEGCIVIEYGPAGTTHYGAEIIGDLGIECNQRLFSTHVDENDIVMGDISRLERAIIEVDTRYHPNCIFVVGSSLTSVIAADIKGTCRMMQGETNAILIPFEHGGFRGDYSLGIRDALMETAKCFVEKTEVVQKKTFTILGACHDTYRIGSDVNELCAIMKACFDMDAICIFPYQTDCEEIRNCAQAELHLVLRDEAMGVAQYIAKQGKGKLLPGAPYGYEGTKQWVLKISELLGITPNKKWLEEVDKKIATSKMSSKQLLFSGLPARAVVEGNAYVVKGIGEFLQKELNFEVLGVTNHSLKYNGDMPEFVKYYQKEKEKLDLLEHFRDGLVLGCEPTLSLTRKYNVTGKITFPVMQGTIVATHLPFVGIRGADFIMESVLTYINEITIRFMMQ